MIIRLTENGGDPRIGRKAYYIGGIYYWVYGKSLTVKDILKDTEDGFEFFSLALGGLVMNVDREDFTLEGEDFH